MTTYPIIHHSVQVVHLGLEKSDLCNNMYMKRVQEEREWIKEGMGIVISKLNTNLYVPPKYLDGNCAKYFPTNNLATEFTNHKLYLSMENNILTNHVSSTLKSPSKLNQMLLFSECMCSRNNDIKCVYVFNCNKHLSLTVTVQITIARGRCFGSLPPSPWLMLDLKTLTTVVPHSLKPPMPSLPENRFSETPFPLIVFYQNNLS